MVDKQNDKILERLIKFIPELAEEIKIENGEICITPKGVEMIRKRLSPKLLGDVFGVDC